MSVMATFTVRQRPHLIRTLSVIWTSLIDAASRLPQLAHT
jgi:hypothetical protein